MTRNSLSAETSMANIMTWWTSLSSTACRLKLIPTCSMGILLTEVPLVLNVSLHYSASNYSFRITFTCPEVSLFFYIAFDLISCIYFKSIQYIVETMTKDWFLYFFLNKDNSSIYIHSNKSCVGDFTNIHHKKCCPTVCGELKLH